MSNQHIAQIHQWKRVVFISVEAAFPNLQMLNPGQVDLSNGSPVHAFTDGRLMAAILERTATDCGPAVLVNPDYIFDGYVLPAIGESLEKYRHVQVLSPEGETVLEGVKGTESIKIDPVLLEFTSLYAKKPSRDPNTRCHIYQRKQFARHHELFDLPKVDVDDETIVIGVPTTSKRTESMTEHPLINILLPNVFASAEANLDIKFVLLIAYDVGDRFLDSNIFVWKSLRAFERRNLSIHFIRMIRTGSVAMIWNVLYDIAMKNGAKYFYQLNDDVTFLDHSWPKAFMSAISAQQGHGVVGPNDARRQCDLMTQNFVGRGHYDIFGFLFPPDFRNWWCDNWLNGVYKFRGLRKCFQEIVILNGAGRKDGSRARYQACKSSDFSALLSFHLDQVEEYFK